MDDEVRNRYLEQLSAEFFKFRESNVLCDTTLITTDGVIPAHSIVLAAASSVFRDAFKTSGCEDNSNYQLELPGISGALAEAVLSLIYTGSSNLSVRDVTNHTLLSEMCQQLGINLVSNKLTDACGDDKASKSCVDAVNEQSSLTCMKLTSDQSRDLVVVTNPVKDSELHADVDSTLLSFGDDVVMEMCIDELESEEIIRIIADDESITAFPFVCDICLGRFDSGLVLRTHRRYHHGCVECAHCGLSFESQVVLSQHLSAFCSYVVTKCNLCSAELVGRKAMVLHAETSHSNELICPTCGQPFLNAEYFKLHETVHKLSHIFTHFCFCGEHCSSNRELADHVAMSHSNVTEHQAVLYCCACGQTFETRKSLSNHLETHGLAAAKSRKLGSSRVNGHCQTAHSCRDCGKSCPHASTLKIHQRSHTGERPFVCEICGQSFKENCLRKHMLVHESGSRPFACNDCPKTFTRISDLQAHGRRHTGEMGFACSECGREFRKKNTLQRHMRVHTGERPYVCETCGKSFKIMFHLQLHRSIHLTERPFHCSVCGKTFQNAIRLKKHAVVHSGVKPYSCPICSRAFNRNANMRAHMRIHEVKRNGTGSSCVLSSLMAGTGFDVSTLPTSMVDERRPVHSCGECGLTFTRLSSLKTHARCHEVTLSVANDNHSQQDCNIIISDLHGDVSPAVEVIYFKAEEQSDTFVTLPVTVQFSDEESNVQYIC